MYQTFGRRCSPYMANWTHALIQGFRRLNRRCWRTTRSMKSSFTRAPITPSITIQVAGITRKRQEMPGRKHLPGSSSTCEMLERRAATFSKLLRIQSTYISNEINDKQEFENDYTSKTRFTSLTPESHDCRRLWRSRRVLWHQRVLVPSGHDHCLHPRRCAGHIDLSTALDHGP